MSDQELLKVLLVDSDCGRAALLSQALQDQGYEVIARVNPGPNLLAVIAQHMPDVVVVDTESPNRDMLESMSLLNEHNPLPVVMFAEDDSDVVVREAISSGVAPFSVNLASVMGSIPTHTSRLPKPPPSIEAIDFSILGS